LAFSEDRTLEGVLATAYDFQGKSDALDLLCKRVGCAPNEVVFVGDRFNDEHVLLKAGLGIAYPPNDYQARAAAQVIVEQDDLLKILPHILVN
jgi:hydroxymethylpyrimidine pyrophosphatase-like HAD family hydrolase